MSLPYFPMYPTDFEAKTSHLTLAEDGAYNRLLRICWMTPGCSIPDDAAWIMRRLRVDQGTFDAVVSVVIDEFFTSEKGRLSNAKLSRIYSETNDAHKKRVSAGSKGGKAKALKTNNSGPSNAKAMLKQPEPEPEPKKKEPKGSRDAAAIDVLSAIVSHQLATDFADHRRGLKRPLTERAAAAMVTKLHGHHNPSAVLNDSIANGWQGIFPEKTKPQFSAINGGRNDGPSQNPQAQRRDPALEQIARLARLGAAPGDGRG